MSFSNSRKQTRQGSRNLCTKLAKEKKNFDQYGGGLHISLYFGGLVRIIMVWLLKRYRWYTMMEERITPRSYWGTQEDKLGIRFYLRLNFNVIKFFFYFLELDFVLVSFLFRNRCYNFSACQTWGYQTLLKTILKQI